MRRLDGGSRHKAQPGASFHRAFHVFSFVSRGYVQCVYHTHATVLSYNIEKTQSCYTLFTQWQCHAGRLRSDACIQGALALI